MPLVHTSIKKNVEFFLAFLSRRQEKFYFSGYLVHFACIQCPGHFRGDTGRDTLSQSLCEISSKPENFNKALFSPRKSGLP